MAEVVDSVSAFWENRRKAQFLKDGECQQCLEMRPLLMPVRFPVNATEECRLFLCLDCRLAVDPHCPYMPPLYYLEHKTSWINWPATPPNVKAEEESASPETEEEGR